MSVETSDGYARLVGQLSPDWRVIECRDRLQWILQRRFAENVAQRRLARSLLLPDPRSANPLCEGIRRRGRRCSDGHSDRVAGVDRGRHLHQRGVQHS
jgi:hypothetical protein